MYKKEKKKKRKKIKKGKRKKEKNLYIFFHKKIENIYFKEIICK